MQKATLILFSLMVGVFSGCATLDELLALKRLGSSQEQIARDIKREEKYFSKLKADIRDQQLKPGLSQDEFLRAYGEPILSRESVDLPGGEVFLYRHPTRYFNSDKVYVYFDASGKMQSWEYIPYEK